ncbi:MAG: hypothetical protein OXM01_13220 [Gemmatimonadota bacterium]|nr:hypothetical protein [Gemmatimonadota bacterium]
MLNRKAQMKNFIEGIISEQKTELVEGDDEKTWAETKNIAQEALDLGYILCEFKGSEFFLDRERIANISVTIKGERFAKIS